MEVIAVLRSLPSGNRPWHAKLSSIVRGDVTQDAVYANLQDCGAGAVVYTVSLNHTDSEKDLVRTMAVNVTPAWKALDLARKIGASRFVYLSVQQVYGRGYAGTFTEQSSAKAANFYGLTHLLCEQIAAHYDQSDGLRCVSLRIASGYGKPVFPTNNCWTLVVNDLCRMAIERQELRLRGNGSEERDFIHIQDIARGIAHFLTLPANKLPGEVVNVGTGSSHTILEVARLVSEIYEGTFGRSIPVYLGDGSLVNWAAVPRALDKRLFYSIDQLRSTGFEPNIPLETGIRELIEYTRSAFSPLVSQQ
jgi:UDP-glucose 4-epimerase